jgi:uncharacterized membrane protein YczE
LLCYAALRDLAPRALTVVFGLACIALGIVCVVRAHLGVDPWTVLLQGVARTANLTLGQSTQVVFVGLLLVNYLVARERPGIGTGLSVLLEGPLIDFAGGLVGIPTGWWGRAVFLLAGAMGVAVGIALYVSPRLGAAPPEGLMFAVQRRLRLPLGQARLLVDGVALAGGWTLGGEVGVGTVITALGVGPLVHVFHGWFQRIPFVEAGAPSLARGRRQAS